MSSQKSNVKETNEREDNNSDDDEDQEVGNETELFDGLMIDDPHTDDDEKQIALVQLYNYVKPMNILKETMETIGRIVRYHVVRNVKFIPDEHTTGLSRDAINAVRKFPSFWNPDLTIKKSIQWEIFNKIEEYEKGTMLKQVRSWLGMRENVLQYIRNHRNVTNTNIQRSVVEGK